MRRKSPTPHRMAKMVSVTQGVTLEPSHIAITLFREERKCSII